MLQISQYTQLFAVASSDAVLTTLIAAAASVVGSFLVYRAQVYVSTHKNGKQKTQQEVSVDVMVAAYDQALANKDIIIRQQAEVIKTQAEEILKLRKGDII